MRRRTGERVLLARVASLLPGGRALPPWLLPGAARVLLAAQIAVLAPVFVEVAFRGILVSQLQRVMTSTQAIWVAAILFGVLHLSALSMAVFLIPLGAAAGSGRCNLRVRSVNLRNLGVARS